MATGTGQAAGTAARAVLKRPYIPVFIALGIMTLIEVQIAFVDIAKESQVFLLMLSAIAKGALVVLYYMHVRYEPRALALLPLIALMMALALLLTLIAETI